MSTTETAPMLRMIWLAGYPRAGAALIRTILTFCFGHGTASSYQEGGLGGGYRHAVGLVSIPQTHAEAEVVAERQPVLTIKTHERPADLVKCKDSVETVPAVVIVRDGRRTLESLRAFYRERNESAYSMTELIQGAHPWGDWSEWHRAWAAWPDNDVRWIRYEDIMADNVWAIKRLAEWLRIRPVAWEIPSFESLHAGSPTIMRKAAVDGNGGMSADEERLFWDRHGAVMSMLGYRREATP